MKMSSAKCWSPVSDLHVLTVVLFRAVTLAAVGEPGADAAYITTITIWAVSMIYSLPGHIGRHLHSPRLVSAGLSGDMKLDFNWMAFPVAVPNTDWSTVKSLISDAQNPNTLKILILSCGCLCRISWSQMLSREWRCSWSSADRRCSNYIWVIDNFIAYQGASYIRGLRYYSRTTTYGWVAIHYGNHMTSEKYYCWPCTAQMTSKIPAVRAVHRDCERFYISYVILAITMRARWTCWYL